MHASVHTRSLDLSSLYRHCVFRSDAQTESHAQVANALSDHGLRWRGAGAADTALFKAASASLQVMALRYGAEVEVTPSVFKDFALVHTTLRGVMEIDSDGRKVCIGTGSSALIAPKKNIRMRWGKDTEQLIIKIPHSLLDQAGLSADARAQSPVLLPAARAGQWELLVQSLLTIAGRVPETQAQQAWVRHFEQNMALFLSSCPSSTDLAATHAPTADDSRCDDEPLSSAESARRLEVLEAYIHKKLCAPVSTFDLAHAVGISVRSLNLLCRRHRACTPMELLRNQRLDAVRAYLLQKPGANVTSAALEHGFGHLGRFAAYYRARFGELPNQTASAAVAQIG